jgi:hypothetical protein
VYAPAEVAVRVAVLTVNEGRARAEGVCSPLQEAERCQFDPVGRCLLVAGCGRWVYLVVDGAHSSMLL